MKKVLLFFIIIYCFANVHIGIPALHAQPDQPAALPQLPSGVTGQYPDSEQSADQQSQIIPKPMQEEETGRQDEISVREQLDRKDSLLRVTTSVDKAKITIGEKITYRIDVVADKNVVVEFPQFGEFLGGFAITDYRQDEPHRTGKTVRYGREYVLDMYVTGTYIIPPARITYKLGDNSESQALFTAPIFVTVESMLTGADTALRDIKPVVTPKPIIRKLFVSVVLAVSFVLIALLVAGFYFWRRRQQYISPGLPPHLIAIHALDQIRQQQLVEAGRVKEYYYLVSNVLRHYIEGRFGLMAPERTTEEFLQELQKTNVLNEDNKSILKTFLVHCDMVKFARFSPTKEQIEEVFATAVQFIDQTKPADVLPEEGEEYDDEEEE
ncbi:MAG: hypothetical protein RBU23_01230 [Candidatus Auribacterota bacterium]|jgi:hypothetical protein|nr:hypothetical protein [Candidatus Auribacterota bacterium]